MKIEIKNRWNGKLIFEMDAESMKVAVEAAVEQEVVLNDADLYGAILDRARLDGARLDGASLVGARLGDWLETWFRDDIWAVCSSAPAEVHGVLSALENGKVNGSTYSDGDCACLVGTIAKVRGCDYKNIEGLKPNSSRPAEQWFMQIRPGYTPANNEAAKKAHAWISQWLTNMQAAFGKVAA